jgi:DNA-binding beta-propeller fold protein YncE
MGAGWQSVPGMGASQYRNVAFDPIGNLYVANATSNAIQMINAHDGTVFRIAGGGGVAAADGAPPTGATLADVCGLGVSATGQVYFTTNLQGANPPSLWRIP